ncbi:serine hydrolase [Actinorhabdospora filicis]|uniref:Serine hydrolase n=1 Tax=Actinorhabdospora filicis TaxID=1785913 RepID=A0A9W6SQ08_9ACTN|nr:serine hydrolase domain-containing protein [Actinorhabdospora filicis]GLZ80860.1 serine hydrolase [Actinorhabdospora filicis]
MTHTIRPIAALLAVLALGLTGCGTVGPAAGPSAGDGLPATAAALRLGLTGLVDSGALVGGEAVLRDGNGAEDVTAGLGDRETGTPYPMGAHSRIASVTKMFTASIVLQLVHEGTLRLDGPVGGYLTGLPHGEGVDPGRITVRQLLRHQSGLPELPDDADPARAYTPRELLALTDALPAQFPPGERMVYTNTNYVLAGVLIEQVTGHAYADELARRITGPLGLSGTRFPKPGERALPGPAPRGYQDGVDVTEQEPSALYSSGGIVSTAADLNRFLTALLDGEVVPAPLLDAMRETVPMPDVPGVGYGLGLMRLPVSCGKTVWGQAGDVPGFQTMTATDGERSVSLLFNQGPGEKLGPGQLLGLVGTALC